jgi:hypothetical protein
MPEFAFIEALRVYLAGPAGLTPAPAQVGGALPSEEDQAPAVVLALQSVRRLRGGLGEGAETVEGILAWTSRIDLAAPFLPGEPGFSLLSPDRRTLTLPHGGLIRADGLDGALGPADIAVSVAGAPCTLVAANPNAGQFTVDALTGQLTFGAAVPAAGEVVANYHLGQWERLAFLIAGELAVTVRAVEADDVAALTAGIGRALAGPNRLAGLSRLALVAVDAIGTAEDSLGGTRGQTARYTFEYEHIVNAPASSGGVIQTTPVTTNLRLLRRDVATGALIEDTITETG